MIQRPLETCSICEKLIYSYEPRVYFGRKAIHGPCFVEHCKRTQKERANAKQAKEQTPPTPKK